MLTQVMEVWHGIVIAVVSLILQACVLSVINFLLSRHMDDSDTSSDSSDSSNSSPPTTCQVTKDVNYTQVVFAAPGDRRNDSVLDYENIKEATDYVNVNPKSHKSNFWTVSDPVEYTQVVM
uniref:Regulator of hemoglobinization and erythroid cell expansion n=1 Tax=Moschus moschiferus TaxID=68415 RepID=A0A8C6CS05_MOSMO